MRKRIMILILFFGVASLTFFASTDVISLFAGQHSFTNISGEGNQIDCVACHHHIADELNHSMIHADLSCEACHRFNGTTDITFASGDGGGDGSGPTPGKEAHAAYTPRCLDCHGGTGVWIVNKTGSSVHAPPARAFGEGEHYGSNYSAHKTLVLKANASNTSIGENEACLVCHTNYSCKISYSYFYNIDYNISNWNISSFSFNGTRNYDIQWNKSGAKHEFLKLSDIKCTKCHKNIYDALVNGTSNPSNENYLTHAPIEIDSTGSSKNWDTVNPWGHYRYHYIPDANRTEWVNNSYCFRCHNVNKYASEHSSENATYDLGNVTEDTNSTEVHCAEALTCASCHGSGRTKEVIDNPDGPGGDGGGGGDEKKGHSGTTPDFVDEVASNYARTFNGDICMGCHEAAVHPDGGGGQCSSCHKYGNAVVNIESEPSGYATNT